MCTVYVCTYIGIDAIIGNINHTPLEGIILMATRPPVVMKPKPMVITNDIKISDLPAEKCSLKVLRKYFSNKKKSGIDTYKGIEIINKTTAILQLHDEKGKNEFCYQNSFYTKTHTHTNTYSHMHTYIYTYIHSYIIYIQSCIYIVCNFSNKFN